MFLQSYVSVIILLLLCTNIHSMNEAEDSDGEEVIIYDEETTTSQSQPEQLEVPRFEGDILGMSREESGNPEAEHNALSSQDSRWPNANVKFKLDPKFFNCFERCIIYEAMKEIEMKTCVSFTEVYKYSGKDQVQILKGTFCASHVGYSPPQQVLYLSDKCLENVGTPLHELMHTLGFFHEHTRRDRDDFVTVNYSNIRNDSIINFQRHDHSNVTNLGFRYDLGSVMHYDSFAFSKNEQPTITVKGNPSVRFGQRVKLSELDAEKLKRYYNCSQDQIGCVDTNPHCKNTYEWKRACKNLDDDQDDLFRSGCLKSCKLCQHQLNRQRQRQCGDADPIQRCRNYAANEYICSNLRYIIYKRC